MRLSDVIVASEPGWQAVSHFSAADRMVALRWRFNRLRCMTAAEIGFGHLWQEGVPDFVDYAVIE